MYLFVEKIKLSSGDTAETSLCLYSGVKRGRRKGGILSQRS